MNGIQLSATVSGFSKASSKNVGTPAPHIRASQYSRVSVRQYYVEIEEAARNHIGLIVPELAKRNGVTETLKADNQIECVRQMNACKAQTEAIVKIA